MFLREKAGVFLTGALGYGALELIWRGRSHWTMLLLGGGCFSLLYELSRSEKLSRLQRYLLGAACITTLELLTGMLVNLRLGWEVWDYSALPWNLKGQICLPYALLWFLLCVPAERLCQALRRGFSPRSPMLPPASRYDWSPDGLPRRSGKPPHPPESLSLRRP